ncbi:MAG: hypothetical protein J6Y28_04230 [Acholeplasmatales bacterium]|nr:hypothetical protein [Methanobrevibacter sp.]MBP5445361.1 hypothetical protein [Acholeplasmatales bacterium]
MATSIIKGGLPVKYTMQTLTTNSNGNAVSSIDRQNEILSVSTAGSQGDCYIIPYRSTESPPRWWFRVKTWND